MSEFTIDAWKRIHYNDVLMGVMAYQITSLTIVCSSVYSCADQRIHQSSASPVPGEFPTQRASNAENVSILWRHHVQNGMSPGGHCWGYHPCSHKLHTITENLCCESTWPAPSPNRKFIYAEKVAMGWGRHGTDQNMSREATHWRNENSGINMRLIY